MSTILYAAVMPFCSRISLISSSVFPASLAITLSEIQSVSLLSKALPSAPASSERSPSLQGRQLVDEPDIYFCDLMDLFIGNPSAQCFGNHPYRLSSTFASWASSSSCVRPKNRMTVNCRHAAPENGLLSSVRPQNCQKYS